MTTKAQLQQEVEALRHNLDALRTENAALKHENAELRTASAELANNVRRTANALPISPEARIAAMRAARALAMRTGRVVKVH